MFLDYLTRVRIKSSGYAWDRENVRWFKVVDTLDIEGIKNEPWSVSEKLIDVLIENDNGELLSSYKVISGSWT